MPSVDMDYEAIGGDIGCMGIYTPVGFPTEVKLGKPNYDLWWRRITPGESDLTGCIFLGLIPRMIIDSAETPALQVTIISANLEPCTASRIKDRISPCIKVNFNGVGGDGINNSRESRIPLPFVLVSISVLFARLHSHNTICHHSLFRYIFFMNNDFSFGHAI